MISKKIGRGLASRGDLESLFGGRSVAALDEGQLLDRFVEARDDLAFSALVDRHGPMVLGVCRRLLADPLDVEDAFQATFLVLVRRARTLKDRDRLAPWLFGVARKVATRARTDRVRRKAREGVSLEEVASMSPIEDQARELGRALVEEIDRLPGSLREPVLLCCVEGLTYDEAATRMRSTAPAVRGRLARARGRLKDRLTRRGFAPALGTSGLLVAAESVSAAVPQRLLLMTTIQAAKAGMVPAGVEFLAEGVIRTMILTKSKILALAVVAVGVAGSSMGLNAQDGPGPAREKQLEADRLDKVEKKLDRVLKALEGSPAPPPLLSPSTTAPAQVEPPRPPDAPSQPGSPTRPEAPPRPDSPPPSTDAFRQITTETTRNGTGTQTLTRSGSISRNGQVRGSVPDSARLDAIEQKLERLETRLDKLERRLGPESRSDRTPEQTLPGLTDAIRRSERRSQNTDSDVTEPRPASASSDSSPK